MNGCDMDQLIAERQGEPGRGNAPCARWRRGLTTQVKGRTMRAYAGSIPAIRKSPKKVAVACSEGGASKLWSSKKNARDYDLSSTPSDPSIG